MGERTDQALKTLQAGPWHRESLAMRQGRSWLAEVRLHEDAQKPRWAAELAQGLWQKKPSGLWLHALEELPVSVRNGVGARRKERPRGSSPRVQVLGTVLAPWPVCLTGRLLCVCASPDPQQVLGSYLLNA